MITFLPDSEIDTEKWDACVRKSPSEFAYAYSWYLDISAPNWSGLILNDYEAVMPLTWDVKWGVKYIFRPTGVQQLGIFSPYPISGKLMNDFLTSIPSDFKYGEVYFNSYNHNHEFIEVERQTNLVLHLSQDYQQIKSNYNSRTKRNLKKGRSHQFSVFQSDSIDRLLVIFKENIGRSLSLRKDFFPVMKQLMYVARHKGMAEVWSVCDETNTVIAGFFILVNKNRKVFLFSAANQYAKETQAMTWLIDQFIQANANSNAIFDFEGSNLPGLRDFYAGFGAENEDYALHVFNRLPWPLNLLKR